MTALHHGSDPELEAVYPPVSVGSGSSVHRYEILYRHELLRAVHSPQQVSVLLEYDTEKSCSTVFIFITRCCVDYAFRRKTN